MAALKGKEALTDMDAELAALEQRRKKTRFISTVSGRKSRENLDFAHAAADASVRGDGGQTAASAAMQRATSSALE